MTNTTEQTTGRIEMDANHTFIWSRSPRGSEIWGFVQHRDGSTVVASGWWRTDDPEFAAKMAHYRLPLGTQTLTRSDLNQAQRWEVLKAKVSEALCRDFGGYDETPSNFLPFIGEPASPGALCTVRCGNFADLDEPEDNQIVSKLLEGESMVGYGLWVEPIDRFSFSVFSHPYVRTGGAR